MAGRGTSSQSLFRFTQTLLFRKWLRHLGFLPAGGGRGAPPSPETDPPGAQPSTSLGVSANGNVCSSCPFLGPTVTFFFFFQPAS